MPFVVPNATDIGTLFGALDQAEPDALDFQILGDRSTGTLSGCTVTASSGNVSVSEGFVALQGSVYIVNAVSPLALPSPPTTTEARFDLVVARLSGSTMSLVVVSGNSSATNPTYPPTPSRMSTTVGVPVLQYINPSTDVVLAAIYRNGAAVVTNASVVDKRVNVPSTTSLRGDAIPSASIGSNGDLYYKNSVGPSASGVYVKRDGAWVELLLQSNTGSVTPIGSIIMWPSATAPDSTFWKECNGQVLSKSTYSTLFSLLGTTYGAGTTTEFALPDLRNKIVRGSSTPGVNGGSDTVNLIIDNIPEHTHSLNNHTHTIGSHTHTATLSGSGTTAPAGSHAHTGDSSNNNLVVRLDTQQNGGYATGVNTTPAGGVLAGTAGFGLSNTTTGMAVLNVSQTQTAGSHDHTFSVSVTGSTDGPSASPTGGPSPAVSGSAGNSTVTPINVLPSYTTMRWFIRVL